MIEQLKSAACLDRRPIFVATLYVVTANFALWAVEAKLPTGRSIWLNAFLYLACITIWLTIKYLWMLAKTRHESAIHQSLAFLKIHLKIGLRTAPVFGILIVFMPTFSSIKGAIFHFNDYSWDETFIDWDSAIHGSDPWQLIQPFLGFPLITYAISVAYQLWFFLIYGGTLLFLFRHRDAFLRERFLIVFFANWAIVGTLLAILFASVGPCFAEPILGIDRYVPQMEYLKSVDNHFPILTDNTQQMLLERYRNRNSDLGAGITAMPSMHVALACLFWLSARHVSRWVGYAAFIFLIVIMLGSVHLAWHYAIDGYASIAITLGLWRLAGYWIEGTTAKQDKG